MLPRDFCYWLQGAIELGGLRAPLTQEQVTTITQHLSMVVLPVEVKTGTAEFVQNLRWVQRITGSSQSKWWTSDIIWESIVTALRDVFEHQLDREVPVAPGHTHSIPRC